MQYTEIFTAVKFDNFWLKKNTFLIFAQNIDCVLTRTHNQYFSAQIRKYCIPLLTPYRLVSMMFSQVDSQRNVQTNKTKIYLEIKQLVQIKRKHVLKHVVVICFFNWTKTSLVYSSIVK